MPDTQKISGSRLDPVVAYLSKQKSPHPYSSIALSPCRQYAVTACKDSLQILRVGPAGIRSIRTVICSPYFQQQVQRHHDNDNLNLNLRDFAFGGLGSQRQQPQAASSSMINVVITDVAWSCGVRTSSDEDDADPQRSMEKDQDLIAAAGSNGVIVVWSASNLLDGISTNQQQQLSVQAPEAILSQHVRAVNRLAWHPSKQGLLLSASQDGTVLLWERRKKIKGDKDQSRDERDKRKKYTGFFGNMMTTAGTAIAKQQAYQWHCRSTFAPKSEAVRDLRWSPFYADVFALVTTSGSLIVYNQYVSAHAIVKMTAHSGDATTLDWHPLRPNVIATGGANDRSVKVWDLEDALSLNLRDDGYVAINSNSLTSRGESVGTTDTSTGNESYNPHVTIGSTTMIPMTQGSRTMSTASNTYMNTSRHKSTSKNMLHVLSISASVTRLRWRPPAHDTFVSEDEDRHASMMAVATAPIKGASAGGKGMMALWSYYRPFMPLSVVDGHKEGITDFVWLDTPQQPTPDLSQRMTFSNVQDRTDRFGNRNLRKEAQESSREVRSASRRVGSAPHEIESILYDNSEHGDEVDKQVGIWQHVLSVGRDGRCLIQSFVRGFRPISRVSPSSLCLANLSPFQKGYGSLQIFSVFQTVPSGPGEDFLLTGLRRDIVTANAPGVFREIPPESSPDLQRIGRLSHFSWKAGCRLPSSSPDVIFNIVDQGELDEDSNPIPAEHDSKQAMVVAPELVHVSRFANRYMLYQDERCPTRVSLCLHNSHVAESLRYDSLANMWRMVAAMLESTGEDRLPDVHQPVNAMQFVILPMVKSLLEERVDAGDVQTCVALCEVLQIVKPDQTVRVPGLEIERVREWYLAYIDLLRDMCLFSHATFLIRSCQDPFIGALNQQSTTFHESCPHCGKALEPNDDPDCTFARRACKSCRRRVGLCFLCHEPVKGVYVWCPGCGHGGHLDHALLWFSNRGKSVREVCPTGCGHKCNLLKELSAFPSTESMRQIIEGDQDYDFAAPYG